jgi:hypothetical protein
MLYNPEWSGRKDILNRAADLIETHGLTKRLRTNLRGFCIHGAVSQVVNKDAMLDSDETKGIMKHIVSYMNSVGINTKQDWIAAQWNNEPERTKEEVVNVLRGAAEYVV